METIMIQDMPKCLTGIVLDYLPDAIVISDGKEYCVNSEDIQEFKKSHKINEIHSIKTLKLSNISLRYLTKTFGKVELYGDVSYMFYKSKFNGDISQWDISSVTNMTGMFDGSKFNGDTSQWDTSSVINMKYMWES